MILSDVDDLLEDTIDTILDVYKHNPEYIAVMVNELCDMFPGIDPVDLEQRIAVRLRATTKSSKRRKKDAKKALEFIVESYDEDEALAAASEQMITKADLDDAYLMGDIANSIDYLRELYPQLSRKEIKKQLKFAVKSDKKASKKRKRKITSEDVDEALEFYGFQFGPDLNEKMIKYMTKKYPTLGIDKITDQLSKYDFDHKIATPPKERSRPTTPPPRGSSYQPNDFSPSSFGATSLLAADFYKGKRSKYLPHYTSPPSTPLPPRGMPTPKRFREDRTPPPRTPTRTPRPGTDGRRLLFSSSSDQEC